MTPFPTRRPDLQQQDAAVAEMDRYAAEQDFIAQQQKENARMQQMQEEQAREAARAQKAALANAKRQGVKVAPDATGTETIQRHPDGQPVYEAGFVGEPQITDKGGAVAYRDARGQRYDVPFDAIRSEPDPAGETFYSFDVTGPDGQKQTMRQPAGTKPLFRVDPGTGSRIVDVTDPATGSVQPRVVGVDPLVANKAAIEKRKNAAQLAQNERSGAAEELRLQIAQKDTLFQPVRERLRAAQEAADKLAKKKSTYEQAADGYYAVTTLGEDMEPMRRKVDSPEEIAKADAWVKNRVATEQALAEAKAAHDPAAAEIQEMQERRDALALETLRENRRAQAEIRRMEEAAKAGKDVTKTDWQQRAESLASDPRIADIATVADLETAGDPLAADAQKAAMPETAKMLNRVWQAGFQGEPKSLLQGMLDGVTALNPSQKPQTTAEAQQLAAKSLGITDPASVSIEADPLGHYALRYGNDEFATYSPEHNRIHIIGTAAGLNERAAELIANADKDGVPVYLSNTYPNKAEQPFNAAELRGLMADGLNAMQSSTTQEGAESALAAAGLSPDDIRGMVRSGKLSVQDGRMMLDKFHGVEAVNYSQQAVQEGLGRYLASQKTAKADWDAGNKAAVISRYMDSLASKATSGVVVDRSILEQRRQELMAQHVKEGVASKVGGFMKELIMPMIGIGGQAVAYVPQKLAKWTGYETEAGRLSEQQFADWQKRTGSFVNKMMSRDDVVNSLNDLKVWAQTANPGDTPPDDLAEMIAGIAYDGYHELTDDAAKALNTSRDTFNINRDPMLKAAMSRYLTTADPAAFEQLSSLLMMDGQDRKTQAEVSAYISAPRVATPADVVGRAKGLGIDLTPEKATALMGLTKQLDKADPKAAQGIITQAGKILGLEGQEAAETLSRITADETDDPESAWGLLKGGFVAGRQELATEVASTAAEAGLAWITAGAATPEIIAERAARQGIKTGIRAAVRRQAQAAFTKLADSSTTFAKTAAALGKARQTAGTGLANMGEAFAKAGIKPAQFGQPLTRADKVRNAAVQVGKNAAAAAPMEALEEGVAAIGEPDPNATSIGEQMLMGAAGGLVLTPMFAGAAAVGQAWKNRGAGAEWEKRKAGYIEELNRRMESVPGFKPLTVQDFDAWQGLQDNPAHTQARAAYQSALATFEQELALHQDAAAGNASLPVTPELLAARVQLDSAAKELELATSSAFMAMDELRGIPESERPLYTAAAKAATGARDFTEAEAKALMAQGGNNAVVFQQAEVLPADVAGPPAQRGISTPAVSTVAPGVYRLPAGVRVDVPPALLESLTQKAPTMVDLLRQPANQTPAVQAVVAKTDAKKQAMPKPGNPAETQAAAELSAQAPAMKALPKVAKKRSKLLATLKAKGVVVRVVNTTAEAEAILGKKVAKGRKGVTQSVNGVPHVVLIGEQAESAMADTLDHEAIHGLSLAFATENPELHAAAMLAVDPASPEFDAALDEFMRREYNGYDKLSQRQKFEEALRAIVEGRWKGRTSAKSKGFKKFLKAFLAYVRGLMDGSQNAALKQIVTNIENALQNEPNNQTPIQPQQGSGQVMPGPGQVPVVPKQPTSQKVQPRPQRNGRDTSARDAWDEKYGSMRKGGRTHNDDGTPYQPTLFDEVMPNILAARSQMTDEEANERLGEWSETRLATSVKTLLNAGWTWDAENQRWRQPEDNPVPNERPLDAILRLQSKTPKVAFKTWQDAAKAIDNDINTMGADESVAAVEAAIEHLENDSTTPPDIKKAQIEKGKRRLEALKRDSLLKRIAKAAGRAFFDVKSWLADNFGDSGWGHVTTGDVLVKAILGGDGHLDPSFNVDGQGIFVNDGPGQAARVRLHNRSGMAPLVFDKGRVEKAGIKVSKDAGAEPVIKSKLPLSTMTDASKERALDVILNELEASKTPVTPQVIAKIAKALGITPEHVASRLSTEQGQTIDAAAHEAATSPTNDRKPPTPAQQEAGNYKMGPVEAPTPGTTPAGTGTVTPTGQALPAKAIEKVAREAIGRIAAKSPRIKALLKESKKAHRYPTGGMWLEPDGKVSFHVPTIVQQLESIGVTDNATAGKRVEALIDEEIRHSANMEAARRLFAGEQAAGRVLRGMSFETWRDAWYGDIWNSHFTDAMRQAVQEAYGDTLPEADWMRAMEGLRMLDQLRATGSITEAVLLALDAILESLREFLDLVTAGGKKVVEAEIMAIREVLAEYGYEGGTVKPDAKKKPAKAKAKQETSKPVIPAVGEKTQTIAGLMDLNEFESKGYAPEQVTRADWVALQRAERRRLGQPEQGDNKNAPWAEYEEFHRDAVERAIKAGEDVDPEVLKDYPDLQAIPPATTQTNNEKEQTQAQGQRQEVLAPAPDAAPAQVKSGASPQSLDKIRASFEGLSSAPVRVTSAQDAEYMAAVERGDMETAQRMVDEAAKTAVKPFSVKLQGKGSSSNGWLVSLGNRSVQVFRDPENGYWYFSDFMQKGQHNPIASNKADAIKRAVERLEEEMGGAQPSTEVMFRDWREDKTIALPGYFLRFGELPAGGRSSIGNQPGLREKGVSVLKAWKSPNGVFVISSATSETGASDMVAGMEERPIYIAYGEDTGEVGSDGEPLLKNVVLTEQVMNNRVVVDDPSYINQPITNNVSDFKDWETIEPSPDPLGAADPVTYDDAGNVIPPSQRFNPQSDSILYSAPVRVTLEQIGLPKERRAAFLDVAESLIADGVNTPEGLARALNEARPDGSLRKYSQALWNFFGTIDPALTGQHDWQAVYQELQFRRIHEAKVARENDNTNKLDAPALDPVRELILSDDNRAKKAQAMKKLAEERGETLKQTQEFVESRLVQIADEVAREDWRAPQDRFEELVGIYDKQPLFSARTSTSMENQAYSTPAPMAFALRHMTGVTPQTSVYDATAGNGMLAIGSDLKNSVANEIDETRLEGLRRLGIGTITTKDATDPTGVFQNRPKAQTVHLNPPFGGIPNVNFDGYGIRKLEHIISLQALKEGMADNGTAAIILGATMNNQEQVKGAQWVFENYLYAHYNVVDNFEISGDLYGNQGAKWPVRILVIAGKKAVPTRNQDLAPKTVDRLDTWPDVWARAERTRYEVERQRQTLGTDGQAPAPSGNPAGNTGTADSRPIPDSQRPAASTSSGSGVRGGNAGGQSRPGATGTGGAGLAAPGATEQPADAGASVQPATGGRKPAASVGSRGGRRPASATNAPSGSSQTGGATDASGQNPANAGSVTPRPERRKAAATATQVPYDPASNGSPFETLVPRGIGESLQTALAEIVANRGPIDQYVADRLDMSVEDLHKAMAAEQIDGVAMAIYQMETGGALIIGDETGIGKGRQAASLIRYAILQGKIPVFFTKDPKLFSDMWGDLKDIGTTVSGPNVSASDMSVRPLILGDSEKAQIKTPDNVVVLKPASNARQSTVFAAARQNGFASTGHNAIFSTYSQIRDPNARQEFLEWLAANDDVVVVLDEAHESAGDGETSMQAAFMMGGTVKRGKGSSKTEITKSGLLNGAGAMHPRGGVLYLSATFAKRPDNMPVYFRTDLRKGADKFSQVVEAMDKGGVALQQAITEALAEAGQYTRRERDFTGVSYAMKQVTVRDEAELVRQVDAVTGVLSDIAHFSKLIRAAVEDSTARTDSQSSMTDFASIVHNQVSQLLLAAKADAVVDEVVEAHKRGEKPIVALMNTMESFLSQYVDDMNIKPGQPMKLNWAALLEYALSRTLRASEKLPNGDTVIYTVDPAEHGLGMAYQRVLSAARAVNVAFPVSPIDYIIQKARAGGVEVGELTGRESGIDYANFQTGEGTYRKFKRADKNTLVNTFNNGSLAGMLLNASGSTGLSIHAASKFKDQKPRHMIIAQPALDINVFIQTLGRIKRTGIVLLGRYPDGSAYGARYSHLTLPLNSELRPAIMAARKMKSLNANTTGESDSAVKIEAEDLMNRFGNQVVAEYLSRNPELQDALNIEVEEKEDGTVVVPKDIARKFTGRMALQPNKVQGEAYAEIISDYRRAIEQAKVTGDYDLEIIVHEDWDATRAASEQIVAGTDESSIFTSSVNVELWDMTDNRPTPSGADMLAEFTKENGSQQQLDARWRDFSKQVDERLDGLEQRLRQRLAEAKGQLAGMSPDDPAFKGLEREVASLERNLSGVAVKKARWRDTQRRLDDIIDEAGRPVMLENAETQEMDHGMLTQIRFPDITGQLRIAPSAFKMTYLLNRPGGRIYPTLAQFKPEGYTQARSQYSLDDMTGDRGGRRERRTLLVGSPIRAYGATGGKGKVVRFKARDGSLVTGILMPRSWNISNLAEDPRKELADAGAVEKYMRDLGWTPGFVESGDSVRIHAANGGFRISAPSARRTGGEIFLDDQLREIVGDFIRNGQRMTARIDSISDVPRVAARVMQLTGKRFKGQDVARVRKANGVAENADMDSPARTAKPKSAVKAAATEAWNRYLEQGGSSSPVNQISRDQWLNRIDAEEGRSLPSAPAPRITAAAEAAARAMQGQAAPAGLRSMFNPQARRPATGERGLFDLPKNQLADTIRQAYQAVQRGQSSVMVPIRAVFQRMKAANPALKVEDYLAAIQEADQRGEVMLEAANTTAEQEANAPFVVPSQNGPGIRMAWVDRGTNDRPPTTHIMPDGYELTAPGMHMLASAPVRAYHGTPHKVDKFTTAKIGTGEGAQAYGWGLYFAENESVAKQYKDSLAHRGAIDLEHEGRKRGLALSRDTRVELIRQANTNKDDLSAARALQYANIEARVMDINALAEIIAARRASVQGNLYTVELLPDADEFLDWDKPLSEQSAIVEKLKRSNEQPVRRFISDDMQFFPRSNGKDLISKLNVSFDGGSRAASEHLSSLGIPGIRYLDGGSRGAGDGTRNYVIFDENLVRILEENGKPVSESPLASSPAPKPNRATQAMRDIIEALPPPHREVLRDLLVNGMSIADAATTHGISETAVGNILRRGEAHIRLMLDRAPTKPTVRVQDGVVKATDGRPDLAMSGNAAVAAVDQRRMTPEEVTHAEMQDLATRLFDVAPAEAENLVVRWMDSGTTVLSTDGMPDAIKTIVNEAQARNAAEMLMTAAAKMLVARKTLEGGNSTQLARLIYLYRNTGTEQARALGMRRDPFDTPEERAAMYLSEALLTPPDAIKNELRRNPANRDRILAAWAKRADQIKAEMLAHGIDLDATFADHAEEQKLVEETIPEPVKPVLARAPKKTRQLVKAIMQGMTPAEAIRAAGLTAKAAFKAYQDFRASLNQTGTEAAQAMRDQLLRSAPAPGADFAANLGLPDLTEAEWLDAVQNNKPLRTTPETEKLKQHREKAKKAGTLDLKNSNATRKAMRAIEERKSNAFEKMSEFWRASILSGPQTHVVNLVSGLTYGAYEASFKKLAAGMQADIARMFGAKPDAASLADVPAMIAASLPSIKLAFLDGIAAWKSETRAFENYALQLRDDNGELFKEQFNPALKGKLGAVMRGISFRLMGAADEFVKSFFTRIEVAAQARQIARNEGKTGHELAKAIQELMEPGSLAWERALGQAKKITFQTEIGSGSAAIDAIDGLAKLITRTKKGDFGKPLKGLAHFTFPFVDTPTNIFKAGVTMSPVGGLLALVDMIRAYQRRSKGNAEEAAKIYNAARALDDLTNQIVAWGFILGLSELVKPGDDEGETPFITGTIPWRSTSPGERELAYRTAPPQSIRIGDRWISYKRLDPFASALAFTVDAIKEFQSGKPIDEVWTKIGLGMMRNMQDKTFLQGVSDVVNAIQDPERFGTKWAVNIATGFVPNLLRQPIRTYDDVFRETDLANDLGFWDSLGRRMGYGLYPMAAMPAITVWGQPAKKDTGTGGPNTDWMLRLLSPADMRAANVDMLDVALLRYNMTHQDGDPKALFGVTAPSRELQRTIGGQVVKISLDDAEYEDFITKAGKAARQAIGTAYDGRDLTEQDVERIKDIISRAQGVYRDAAFVQAVQKRGGLNALANTTK